MALTIPPTSPLGLQTLSNSGTPPKMRLSSAMEAQNLFWLLKEAAAPRLAKAALIQGMFDGNPPFSQAKRRSQAEANRPNFNSLEAASRKDAAKVPFYDLLTSSSLFADCATNLDSQIADSALASRVRSEAFDTMLRSYPGFDMQFWLMLDDFVAFNKGFMWWPTPDSWHFKRLPWNRVLFPDGTSTDPDEWEVFAIEHRWPAHKIYNMAEKAPADSGWNFDRVVQAIRYAAPADLAKTFLDPMRLQQMMRDSDLYVSSQVPKIHAASVYTREFDGSWSRMMVETSRAGEKYGNASGDGRPQSRVERGKNKLVRTDDSDEARLESKDWLYQKRAVAKELHEIMCPFIFEAGDGSINELAGLGKKIVSMTQVGDRLLNDQVFNTTMRSSIVLQATQGTGLAKASTVQVGGGLTVIPPGFAIQQSTIMGDIEGGMAMSQDLVNRLDRNTGIYRPTFEKPTGNPESATAAGARMSQATVLSNSAVNRYYTQVDKFYDELYRRATLTLSSSAGRRDKGIEAALKFQDDCKEHGLSREQCTDRQPGKIRAVRAIGNGSAVMRQQTASQLSQLVPFLGPRGLQAWKEMFAAAFGNQTMVNRLLPPADTAQVPTRDEWDATIENDAMNQGNQPVFAGWQDMQVHAQVHLAAGFAAVKAVLQSGADPAIPFTFLQIMMPHAAQHISKVPREQIRKELSDAYQKLSSGARQVMQAAQQAHQQQGQQQQLSFEQQLEVQKTQHDIQLKDAKTQAQMKQRAEKQQFDMQLAQQKQQADTMLQAGAQQTDARLRQQEAAQQAALNDATTAHDIVTSTAKTAASIKHDHMKASAQAEAIRNKPKASSEQ